MPISAYPMGLPDIGIQYISGICRNGLLLVSQKGPLSLKDENADLPVQFMTVHGKYRAGHDVEIGNFNEFGIVQDDAFHPRRLNSLV